MRLALALVLLGAVAHGAPVPTKPNDGSLARLNALTAMLAPKATVAAADLERLISVGEGVALRDAARRPTPATVICAAAIEQSIRAGTVKGEHAQAVLAELTLALVPLAGPQAAEHAASFYPELLTALNIDAKDANPRPELPAELVDIGHWAERALTSLAQDLPARAPIIRIRAALLGGHYAEAIDLARQQTSSTDPRWRAWLGAALLASGKRQEAEPHLVAARSFGGEAAAISRDALDRVDLSARLATAAAALAAAGVTPHANISAIVAECVSLTENPKAKAKPLLEAVAVACADLRFSDRSGPFLAAAARHAPAGPLGAPIRAAHALRSIFDRNPKSTLNSTDRKSARDRYLAEVAAMPLDPPTARVLAMVGHVGAAERPSAWAPSSDAENQLLSALDREAPCESASFALRAMAARHDPALMARMLSTTIGRCTTAPGGAAVTADAIQLYLQLSYDTGASLPDEVGVRAAEIARARPDDAEAIAVHADAIALKALAAKRAVAPLEAALSRYEDAIAHTSPAADQAVRQRLESNAAYLSVLLGQLANEPKRRTRFYDRAAQHLRLAIAFGETPALMAVRAQWDIDTKSGKPVAAQELSRFPPSPSRARAACTLARQATAQGKAAQAKALQALAKPANDAARGPRVPELLIETVGLLEAVVDGKGLRPEVALHTHLFLTPACAP